MARLIDADKLGMYFADVQLANRGWRDDVCELLDDVMYALEEAPTIDAVEVVRCKDCKWFDPREEIEGESWTGYCIYGEFHTDEMDFCSRGERKKE